MLTHPTLTSCCAARFLTGLRPVSVRGPGGLETPVSTASSGFPLRDLKTKIRNSLWIFFSFSLKKKNYLFIYFWLRWVFAAACGLSPDAVSEGYSSSRCVGFSLRWPLPLQSTGSKRVGLSSCGTWAQQLWHTGSAAPRHVGSSRTRAQTHVPCIGRQIPNHCATREVPGEIPPCASTYKGPHD